MWRMLQARRARPTTWSRPGPRTRSGTSSQLSFAHAGLDWEKYVRYDERYERPTEVDALIGDASQGQASCSAGKPQVHTPELVRIMVDADLAALTPED